MQRRYASSLSTHYEDEVIYVPGQHVVWFQAVGNKIIIQTSRDRLSLGPFDDVYYFIDNVITPAVANTTPQMIMFYNNDEDCNGVWTARVVPILSESEKSVGRAMVSEVSPRRETASFDEHNIICISMVFAIILIIFSAYLYVVYRRV